MTPFWKGETAVGRAWSMRYEGEDLRPEFFPRGGLKTRREVHHNRRAAEGVGGVSAKMVIYLVENRLCGVGTEGVV